LLKCKFFRILGGMIRIQENIKLAPYTNYKIGGKARYFCEISTQIDADKNTNGHKKIGVDLVSNLRKLASKVFEALKWAEEKGLPVFVLGGGTNTLVSDSGFNGLVIRIKNTGNDIEIINPKSEIRNPKQIQNSKFKIQNSEYITVNAGAKLSDVVNFSLKNGLSGLEWAAGIPGTVGGAIRGNAGAFGHDMASIAESVTVIQMKNEKRKTKSNNEKFKIKILNNKQCGFGYRTSIIKEKGRIVLGAVFALKKLKDKNEKLKIIEEAKNHINYRKEHHPLEYPSCGSVFKNIDANSREWKMRMNANKKMGGMGEKKKILVDINRYELILEEARKQDLRGFVEKIGVNSRIVLSAGLLIAKADLSGKRIGDAQISEKHSNFIVNLGKAKASDVYALIKLCEKEVYEKFGVKLEREVEFVGFRDRQSLIVNREPKKCKMQSEKLKTTL
jgi:UDP-N-acetylmuramate dehydrogenase